MPSLLTRFLDRIRSDNTLEQKASVVYPGYGGQTAPGFRWLGNLPGSTRNFERDAGDPWRNSAVSNALGWVNKNFPEPPLRVMQKTSVKGKTEDVAQDDHPLLRLLLRPNADQNASTLWASTVLSWMVDGNAYWMKSRGMGGAGAPVELHSIPHWQIAPQWPQDGSKFISHYAYWVEGKAYRLEKKDVVHFRCGEDPYNRRLGLGPLKAVLREIFADNECSTYTAAILSNMGIPAYMISPKDPGTEIDDSARQAVKEQFRSNTTGDQRGDPIVPSYPIDVTAIGISPEQMALQVIRNTPEERIAGAFGLPPIVIHLGAGLSKATYSNYETAVKSAYYDCLMPMQREMARTLEFSLLPDLSKNYERERVEFDYSSIAALQENQEALFKRMLSAMTLGAITRTEAREQMRFSEAAQGTDWMKLTAQEMLDAQAEQAEQAAAQQQQNQAASEADKRAGKHAEFKARWAESKRARAANSQQGEL